MPTITIVTAKVARKAGSPTLFEKSFREDVITAIDPTVGIERYGRTWHFSKPTLDGDYLFGKLGYTQPSTEVSQTRYDESSQDFIDETNSAEQSNYSQWVLD